MDDAWFAVQGLDGTEALLRGADALEVLSDGTLVNSGDYLCYPTEGRPSSCR